MALATLFAFLMPAHDGLPNMGIADEDLRLSTQPGVVLVSLFNELRKTIEEKAVFALFCKADFDVEYDSVLFNNGQEVLCLDDSINGWFLCFRGTAEVSNVQAFELVGNKRTLSRACHIVEEYTEVRVFVRTGLALWSVAEAQRQSADGVLKWMGQDVVAVIRTEAGWTSSQRDFSRNLQLLSVQFVNW